MMTLNQTKSRATSDFIAAYERAEYEKTYGFLAIKELADEEQMKTVDVL